MYKPTRREFLAATAAAGAMAAVGGIQTPASAQVNADMAIAKWSADAGADVAAIATKLTEQAMTNIGGMSRFVTKGASVWIKPNIAWNRGPEFAANTNPDVVATLIRLCLEAGAKTVRVGDHTCHNARQSYPASGIEAAAQKAGAEVVYLEDRHFKEMTIGGERIPSWPLYAPMIEADLLINVPVLKHHSLSTATMCMKNYMGVIGGNRGNWHQGLGEYLRDITAFLKPKLCVLDAVRILTANGPTGGDLGDVKQLNIVAAGTDIVALDSYGCELLGHDPANMPTVKIAAASGLGKINYRELALKEVAVS